MPFFFPDTLPEDFGTYRAQQVQLVAWWYKKEKSSNIGNIFHNAQLVPGKIEYFAKQKGPPMCLKFVHTIKPDFACFFKNIITLVSTIVNDNIYNV